MYELADLPSYHYLSFLSFDIHPVAYVRRGNYLRIQSAARTLSLESHPDLRPMDHPVGAQRSHSTSRRQSLVYPTVPKGHAFRNAVLITASLFILEIIVRLDGLVYNISYARRHARRC